VVIPAYNAEGSIKDLLQSISKHVPLAQVIIVDDGSSDRTSQITCSVGAKVVRHLMNRGKGAALRSGLKAAFEEPSVLACITLDADGQHEPAHIPEFLSSFHDHCGDLIIGARRISPVVMPIMRVLSNRITSALISAKIGQKILDSQCGYRLINRQVYSRISLDSDGFEIESEMLIKAGRLGMKISWVPISTIYSGERSYIKGFRDTLRFIKTWLKF
jgi:glycosyltransferase involved in cell wall biosynthesis